MIKYINLRANERVQFINSLYKRLVGFYRMLKVIKIKMLTNVSLKVNLNLSTLALSFDSLLIL